MEHGDDAYHQPPLPFSDSTWADDLLVYEYSKHCETIRRGAHETGATTAEQLRVAQKLVRNTEWYWLQQILFRFHGELSMAEMTDSMLFRKRIETEQGHDSDKLV